eukprot:3389313-Pyramimonas_sp.AAC.1
MYTHSTAAEGVRRGSGGGPEGKCQSSVASLVSLGIRRKVKNTRDIIFKVCCTVHEGICRSSLDAREPQNPTK